MPCRLMENVFLWIKNKLHFMIIIYKKWQVIYACHFYYLYNAQPISITQSDLYENIPQVYPPVSISLYFQCNTFLQFQRQNTASAYTWHRGRRGRDKRCSTSRRYSDYTVRRKSQRIPARIMTLTNHTMANLLKESASSHIITVHGVIHPSLSLWNISSKEIRKSITLFIIPDQGMVILVRLKFTPLPIPIEKNIRFKELMTSKWKILRAESYSRKG